MKDSRRELGLSYLKHQAIADKDKARLSLELLLNCGAGVGEHSTGDYHKDLDDALALLVDAQDRMDVLHQSFGVEF